MAILALFFHTFFKFKLVDLAFQQDFMDQGLKCLFTM